jgi:hypothetical protein
VKWTTKFGVVTVSVRFAGTPFTFRAALAGVAAAINRTTRAAAAATPPRARNTPHTLRDPAYW